jgi:formamidopyrimidine-DNA glycosylase
MPELPEVETIARGVDKRVRGQQILQVWFASHRQPFKTPATTQARQLEGCRILSVHRTGKHIVCELGAGEPKASTVSAQWLVHLGMTGRLLVSSPAAPVAPHTHARITLSGGLELRFVDPRRFGRLDFLRLSQGLFQAPGAEPFTIDRAGFYSLFHGCRSFIKAALLNQSLLAGVGNIYADESLFRAGIRPRRRAARLTGSELERLRRALVQVLQDAIRLGGSSVSDYVDADGEHGFFQLEHCVYQRTGRPCLKCKTLIRRIEVAGRGTHYCPKCQK